ncbi:MAG: hypothetical protein WAW90_00665, partial [Minisyncoccia bacterium]
MKKLLTVAGLLASSFVVIGTVRAEEIVGTTTSTTAGQVVAGTPGDVANNMEKQIQGLRKEMEAKIKAIRTEYQGKIE